jgi:hypothetical protein
MPSSSSKSRICRPDEACHVCNVRRAATVRFPESQPRRSGEDVVIPSRSPCLEGIDASSTKYAPTALLIPAFLI